MALKNKLAFLAAEQTHVGQLRDVNQDASLITDDIFAVADGMGGHAAGDIAAEIAVDALANAIRMASVDDLVVAVKDANKAIVKRATAEPELKGMGTTVVALAVFVDGDAQHLALINVGDSRGYRFSNGVISQLTDDHSLVADLVRDGMLRPDQAEQHPQRNVITRALGIDTDVQVDSWIHDPKVGDRYLLCSDGLFNEVKESEIAKVMSKFAHPEDAVDELVDRANAAGGRDNITVVIVDVVDPKAKEPAKVRASKPSDGAEDDAAVDDPTAETKADVSPVTAPEPAPAPTAESGGFLSRILGRKKGTNRDGAK